HFDFVCGARENGRAAAGTEKPPSVVACFAIDRHRILREHRGSVKKGPMMLAAVETVTKPDPVWESRRHNSDVAAKATARESVHAASPPKSSGRSVYNEPRRASMKVALARKPTLTAHRRPSRGLRFLPGIERWPQQTAHVAPRDARPVQAACGSPCGRSK